MQRKLIDRKVDIYMKVHKREAHDFRIASTYNYKGYNQSICHMPCNGSCSNCVQPQNTLFQRFPQNFGEVHK